MHQRDQEKGDGLVAEIDGQRYHYVVMKDSDRPGDVDGHGGREFTIEFIDRAFGKALWEKGFKFDNRQCLVTRNLWSQDLIPKAHWSKFSVNCKITS